MFPQKYIKSEENNLIQNVRMLKIFQWRLITSGLKLFLSLKENTLSIS